MLCCSFNRKAELCTIFFSLDLWSCSNVLRGIFGNFSFRSPAAIPWTEKQTHSRAVSSFKNCAHQQIHLPALPLAVLRCLQEIPVVPVQNLHHWAAQCATWEVGTAYLYPHHCQYKRCTLTHSYFLFQPVLHDWCNKGRGMCYPVCGMVHIKEPLLLIDKVSLCGWSGFPFSLSEWSLTICLTPYNRR